jgi:hypothetical protein
MRPSTHPRRPGRQPKKADADQVEFLVGFPCHRFNCRGRLSEGSYDEATAVVCSGCGFVYYRSTGSRSTATHR